MIVTEFGMVISVKLAQFLKASSPIFVTEFGMKMFSNDIKSLNA